MATTENKLSHLKWASNFHNLGAFLCLSATKWHGLNLAWQWSGLLGLCACSVTFLLSWWVLQRLQELHSMKRKKKPAFALFCFDKQANFCPGSSIFLTRQWRHKYRMNVPLLCLGSHMSPSINTKYLDLFVSLFRRLTKLSPAPSGVWLLSISCIINNIQFGLLNYENTLWGVGGLWQEFKQLCEWWELVGGKTLKLFGECFSHPGW